MSEKPPQLWGDLMRRADVGDPRNGEPSYGALARKAGLGVETVRKAVLGIGVPKESTLQQIADALRVDVRVVGQMVGRARDVREPYEPPDSAHLMDDAERKAVDRIIRLLTRDRLAGEHGGRDTAPIAAVAELRPDKSDRGLRKGVIAARQDQEVERYEDRHET